jgi:A/G-specific adenine glycosylase
VHHKIIEWYEANGRDLPWRHPNFTPWGALVSEFMLQQTPVARVIPRLAEWLDRWPTPTSLAAVPAGDAVRAWANLGYPRRALWLHACAEKIVREHGGVVPSDVAALLALPGVGSYTARAVAVFAFGAHEPVVDTNIRRVIARHTLGQAEPGPPREKPDMDAMRALLPEPELSPAFNIAVMELGALVCTARNPRCELCPIRATCAWRTAGYPAHDGPTKARQKKYEGSDRQARGAILAALRASACPIPPATLEQVWPEAAQRGRAVAGLLSDGLIVLEEGDTFGLPS